MKDPKLIAFYLPQFHVIPENDEWWGDGFTEWTNVRKARPLFEGHYQPHVPHEDIGYYDLSDVETQKRQAEMARRYGIHGFCYYHYWFNGKEMLETPLDNLLKHQEIDFPFCVCWANENWTRGWDGLDEEVLILQQHGEEDDVAYIRSLIPALKDRRYIRVGGKPLVLIYRPALLPDAKQTTESWKEEARKSGIEDLYVVRVENFDRNIPPQEFGCDAGVKFAPGHDEQIGKTPETCSYEALVSEDFLFHSDYPLFKCVCPGWDNSPRRGARGTVFQGSSPEKYSLWLKNALRYTEDRFQGDERLLFVNAWNEWGEGAHLEPDEKYGYAWLVATKNALSTFKVYDGFIERFLMGVYARNNERNAQIQRKVQQLDNEIAKVTKVLNDKESELELLESSKFWKLRGLCMGALGRVAEAKGAALFWMRKTLDLVRARMQSLWQFIRRIYENR